MYQAKAVFDVSIENDFDFSSNEYVRLFAGSSATAFQHPIWLQSIYSKLAPACGARRLVITVRGRANGELAMLLPLLRIRRGPIRTVEFADLRVSDYIAPICSPSAFSELLQDENACGEIRRLLQPFDLLRIPKLPDGMVSLERLLEARPRVALEASAYSVGLNAPFERHRITGSSFRSCIMAGQM